MTSVAATGTAGAGRPVTGAAGGPLAAAWLAASLASVAVAPLLAHAVPWSRGGTSAAVVAAAALAVLAAALLARAAGPRRRRLALASTPLLLAWLELLPAGAVPRAAVAPATLVLASVAAGAVLLWRPAPEGRRTRRWAAAAGAVLFAATWALPRLHRATPLYLVLGVLWGLYVLAALAGWGGAVARALLPGSRAPWALRTGLGLAAAVVAGGVLNLTWTASRLEVLALLAAGAALALAAAVRERRGLVDAARRAAGTLRSDPVVAVLAAAVVLLAALELAGAVHGTINNVSLYRDFDVHDDYQAYLVYPEKMLANGALGAEPFDARRIITLGGQSFLQALVLAGLPVRSLHLMDAGVALLLVVALLLLAARERGVDPRLALALAAGALVAPHVEARGNTSAVLTGTALLLLLFVLLDGPGLDARRPWRNAAALALPAAALCAVKLTFLPAAVLLLLFSYGLTALRREGRRAVLAEAGAAAVLTAAMVAPWMIALRAGSGTFLYPLLGQGFYGSVWTHGFAAVKQAFPVPPMERLDLLLRGLLPVLPVAGLAVFARERGRRFAVLALALAAVGGSAAMALAQDPYLQRSVYRYVFPVALAAVLALLAAALAPGPGGRHDAVRVAGAVGIGLLTLQGVLPVARQTVVESARNAAAAVSGRSVDYAPQSAEMAALQRATPPGAAFLARLPYPFLLDFRRNPVLLDSLPGMASPPPGMPTFAGPEPVARFLLTRSVRYVAYGSRTDPTRLLDLTEKDIADRYPRSRVRWVMLAYHRDFEASVEALASSRRHLADEPQSFVLDLATWELRPGAASPPVSVEGAGADGWTDGDLRASGLGWTLGPGPHEVVAALHGWHPWADDPARLDARLEADGRPLELLRASPTALVFGAPAGLERITTLRLRSATFRGRDVGAADDEVRGLDLEAVRVGAGAAEPDPGTVDLAPGSVLRPEEVPGRTGFFPDNNWTDGDAVLSGFRLPVPAADHRLVVRILPAHPFRADAERLAVRVTANGIPLVADGADDGVLRFLLYRGVREIGRLRLASSTFVPRDLGIGGDTRRLGVPVASVSTAP